MWNRDSVNNTKRTAAIFSLQLIHYILLSCSLSLSFFPFSNLPSLEVLHDSCVRPVKTQSGPQLNVDDKRIIEPDKNKRNGVEGLLKRERRQSAKGARGPSAR